MKRTEESSWRTYSDSARLKSFAVAKTKLHGHIGETFIWMADEDNGEHIHVIVSEPNLDDLFVAVPVSTAYKGCDQTALIDPNRCIHPSIKRQSFIEYDNAKILHLSTVNSELGTCRQKVMLDSQFSTKDNVRFQFGVLDSERTPDDVLHFFKSNLPKLPNR